MPEMSGHEVCRILKSQPQTRAIPRLFLSPPYPTLMMKNWGLSWAPSDYITKPVSPPIVRARVKNHLSLVRVEELLETRLQIVQRRWGWRRNTKITKPVCTLSA